MDNKISIFEEYGAFKDLALKYERVYLIWVWCVQNG